MTRAYFRDSILDVYGNALAGASVRVESETGGTLISETLYAAASGIVTLANPIVTGPTGSVEFYLADPQRVNLVVDKSGYIAASGVADVGVPAGGGTSPGPTGPQGIQGAAGSQGAAGPQGIQGVTGSQGAAGPQGDAGSQGAAGSQGIQGDTGSQGIQGVTGSRGIQGVTGTAGTNGVDSIAAANIAALTEHITLIDGDYFPIVDAAGPTTKKVKLSTIMEWVAAQLGSVTPAAGAYRFAGLTSAGAADGSTWANRWAYTAVNWAALTAQAASLPTYLFLDGGSAGVTYTAQMTITGSGSSNTNRIILMPGYAANAMGVPGDHSAHVGVVDFDLQGAAVDGIYLSACSYVTIDGYTDPRPHGAGNSHFKLHNVDDPVNRDQALIKSWGNAGYINLHRLEFYQGAADSTTTQTSGDATNFNYTSLTTGHHIVSECYCHDLGYHDGSENYGFTGGTNTPNMIVAANELYNVGWGASLSEAQGEGANFWDVSGETAVVYNNLFIKVGSGVGRAAKCYNNTFWNCALGYRLPTQWEALPVPIYIENNIFAGFTSWANNAECIHIGQTGNTVHLSRNVFYGNTANGAVSCNINGNWYAALANLNDETDADLYRDATNLVAASNPLTDPPTDCTLLDTASDCVDNAYTAHGCASDHDFAGVTRTTADVGAFEYVA